MSSTDIEPTGPTDRKQRLKEMALLAPHLVKLIWRIARDSRVPARTKAMLFIAIGYLATPIDLIPDWFAGIGQADDLLVAAFALDQVLNRIPAEIVREHWDGDDDILAVIQEILDIASGFVPSGIRKRLGGK